MAIVLYLIYKYVKYVYNSLSKPTAASSFKSNTQDKDVKVNINQGTGEKRFKEGEYIDFEDVEK